ncbi:hypothetical protein L1049_001266 [Liquidambar formosana]|uniref:F-box protein n=1 Tax=Liquidambar formosana TaxID=63359 RepID=A0AAP0R893_LIQFO
MADIGGKLICRRNDNWIKLDFVDDIISNILSRVPVRSLGIWKTVSKHWHTFICSPDFIGLQLSWSRENPIYIIYPYVDEIMTLYLLKANGDLEQIILPGFEDVPFPTMTCSYNGLICCINYACPSPKVTDVDIRICNPATRDVLLLPKGSPSKVEPTIGVAFGSRVNEYKVFRFFEKRIKKEDGKEDNELIETEVSWGFSYEDWESDSESNEEPPDCEIYSSITGSWRGIGSVEYRPMGYHYVCVNGIVYWFIGTKYYSTIPVSILSVDMEENFRTIDLPAEATEHSFLVDLQGCLLLIIVGDEHDHSLDIWVLQDRNESTWVNRCSSNIPIEANESVNSVSARKNELLFTTSFHYFIFNLDDKTWREVIFYAAGFDTDFSVAFSFTESLLPCNGILGS